MISGGCGAGDEFDAGSGTNVNVMESSSCSSNSHMDQSNQHSPVSSESCMNKSMVVVVNDEHTINYDSPAPVDNDPTTTIVAVTVGDDQNVAVSNNPSPNSMSTSIVSINEPSIILLD